MNFRMSTRTFSAPSFYRFGFNTQEKSIELNSGGNLTTALFWEYDSRTGRRWNVDPENKTFESTYSVIGSNPIANIDPLGDNWFFYQEKGSKEKTWHWHKGKKTSYIDQDGNRKTIKSKFKSIVFFEKEGTNLYGAETGTLRVYNQDKLVVEQKGVFTGSGWWATGENPFNGSFNSASKGNYMLNLGERDVMKNNQKVEKGTTNPSPNFGIQLIPNGTFLIYPDGTKYNVNRDYGNGRIRLNPVNDKLIYDASKDYGYYLHGKGAWYNRTHGCVCDKTGNIFMYFWKRDLKNFDSLIPFVIK